MVGFWGMSALGLCAPGCTALKVEPDVVGVLSFPEEGLSAGMEGDSCLEAQKKRRGRGRAGR